MRARCCCCARNSRASPQDTDVAKRPKDLLSTDVQLIAAKHNIEVVDRDQLLVSILSGQPISESVPDSDTLRKNAKKAPLPNVLESRTEASRKRSRTRVAGDATVVNVDDDDGGGGGDKENDGNDDDDDDGWLDRSALASTDARSMAASASNAANGSPRKRVPLPISAASNSKAAAATGDDAAAGG